MDNSNQFNGLFWHAIQKLCSWGYHLSKQDTEDLLQEGRLAAWKSKNLGEDSRVRYIVRTIYYSFYHQIQKRSVRRDSLKVHFKKRVPSDILTLDNLLVEKEEIEEFSSTVEKNLGSEELKYLVESFDSRFLISLTIPHSEFASIRNKLGYLRMFTDANLTREERKAALSYTEVLLGIRNRFPNGALDNHGPFFVRYLLDTVLEIGPKSNEYVFRNLMRDYGLISLTYRDNKLSLLQKAYPGMPKWEFRLGRRGGGGKSGFFWREDLVLDAIKYFAEKKGIGIQEVKRTELCKEMGLEGILKLKFGSMTKALEALVAQENQPPALKQNNEPQKPILDDRKEKLYQNIDNLIAKIQKDYQLRLEEMPNFFKESKCEAVVSLFEKYGHKSLLEKFRCSTYKLFDYRYPQKFYPWEFHKYGVFMGLKDNETKEERAAEVTRWFVEKKLKLQSPREILKYSREELLSQFTRNHFSGITNLFCRSPYRILDNAYPNTFVKEDFACGRRSNCYGPLEHKVSAGEN